MHPQRTSDFLAARCRIAALVRCCRVILRPTGREVDLSIRLALYNPSLPPIPILLPFPGIMPTSSGLVALTPSHHHRIALTG